MRPIKWAITEKLFPSDQGRVIANARLALAAFAFAGFYLDPISPARDGTLTLVVLAGYLVGAAIIVAVTYVKVLDGTARLLFHVFDFAGCATLIILTGGAMNPITVFFAFLTVSGALFWSATGALATTAALAVVWLRASGQDFAIWSRFDTNAMTVGGGYLLIGALLFVYVGVYRQRNRDRLAKLVAWPPVEAGGEGEISLTALLRHAALVLRLEHVIVVWEDISNPGWRVSHFNSRDGETGRRHGGIETRLVSDALTELAFMGTSPAGNHALTAEGARDVQAPLVAPGVFNFLQIRSFSSAPFEAAHFRGRVFIVDPHTLSVELLSWTEIIAGRIGMELEHFGLRGDLEKAAAAKERTRLGRDMHDSILQELTAARLQLAGMSAAATSEAKKAIDHAANMLAAQQRRIREFVVETNPRPTSSTLALPEAIQPVLDELANLWRCHITGQFHPERATVTAARLPQVRLILAEAVANAIRHGKATHIDVTIESDAGLWIEVRDNGAAATDNPASSDQIAPFSLRQRVRALGGGCNLTIGADGGTLVVALPAA